jgi:hypothetical protein
MIEPRLPRNRRDLFVALGVMILCQVFSATCGLLGAMWFWRDLWVTWGQRNLLGCGAYWNWCAYSPLPQLYAAMLGVGTLTACLHWLWLTRNYRAEFATN